MKPRTVARKLVDSHLAEGTAEPGAPIALTIDQTLTQDATGTMVMLELEALGLDRVRTRLSAQYVDHNLLQTDFRNADDHRFLRSACRRFGVWYSRPGNGVSHPVHMERFGVPGQTLLGSDSHTCAAGSLGMLAIGAGGLAVAMAMVGEPYRLTMPSVFGVRLEGHLPPWVSAKDVILEMLRRHGVEGGLGHIIEYHGPGVATLNAMDSHVIANMGAELGATTTVFPSDGVYFGVLPLRLRDPEEFDRIEEGDILEIESVARALRRGQMRVENRTKGERYTGEHRLDDQEVEMVLAGGLIEPVEERLRARGAEAALSGP